MNIDEIGGGNSPKLSPFMKQHMRMKGNSIHSDEGGNQQIMELGNIYLSDNDEDTLAANEDFNRIKDIFRVKKDPKNDVHKFLQDNKLADLIPIVDHANLKSLADLRKVDPETVKVILGSEKSDLSLKLIQALANSNIMNKEESGAAVEQ